MGDNNTGGGGSVQWKVEANSVDDTGPNKPKNNHTGSGRGPHLQDGLDNEGEKGDFFTVSIRVPAEGFASAQAFLDQLDLEVDPNPGSGQQRVYFNLEIEKNTPDQIRVSWGESNNHRGKGGKRRTQT